MTTVDPTEQGEWFEPAYLDEHRAGAPRLTLGEGDVKTLEPSAARTHAHGDGHQLRLGFAFQRLPEP